MQITQIHLKNFRGYYSLLLDFQPGINVLVGSNASGKTNLLEAIHYLSFAKSFRGVEDRELIKNSELQAVINAKVATNTIKTKIDVLIDEKGKKIQINDKGISKLSELNKVVNVIVFEPKDVNIFKDSPKNRRNYLDISISKLNPVYSELIARVEVLIKERNELLKTDSIDKIQLEVVTNQLIKEEKQVIEMREGFVEKLNKVINKVAKALTGDNNEVKIVYFPYVKLKGYEENAKKAYDSNLESDIKHKATSVGIHREDFILNFNHKNIALQGSQGENRLMAIALKLSPYFLVEDKSKHPIVALDDVMSELDSNHQRKLMNFLRKLDQVFITTTKINIDTVSIYEVNKHQIIRRK